MMINQYLVKKCISCYRSGGSRMDVARLIMDETSLKETAAKKQAKVIWDNEFDEEYIPLNQRNNLNENMENMEDNESSNVKFQQNSINAAVAESVKSSDIRTLDELLKECQVDLDHWKVERHIVNKWSQASKNADGDLIRIPLFQVKAFLRRKETHKVKEAIELFKQELTKVYSRPVIEKHPDRKYMYEISIPDLHLSKLCWGKETGIDYNIDIAVDLFKTAFYNLLDRVDLNDVDKLLIPIGNDFFNSEGLSGATTKGTRQTDDSRWPKSFSVGCNMICRLVDEVSQKVNVSVVIVPGNHDFERCYYLGEFLRAWYKDSKAVEIDNAPTSRKYVKFGENLLLLTHGNEEKIVDLPLIMATESPHFSECKYRTAHIGHTHQYQAREDKGVSVKVLPSLCPADSWHYMKGFVNNKRSAISFLYDPKMGEIANYFYYAD